MNFLSHYYLHEKKEDPYFTVGLSMPDLFSFIFKKIYITEKFLYRTMDSAEDARHVSLLRGMVCHLRVDKWFHLGNFFKNHLRGFRELYTQYEGFKFSEFHSHILLEILIDRYLLISYPGIARNYYQVFKEIDYSFTAIPFRGLKNFETPRFIQFMKTYSRSSFLFEYKEFSNIYTLLNRAYLNIGLPVIKRAKRETALTFFKEAYESITGELEELFSEAKTLDIE